MPHVSASAYPDQPLRDSSSHSCHIVHEGTRRYANPSRATPLVYPASPRYPRFFVVDRATSAATPSWPAASRAEFLQLFDCAAECAIRKLRCVKLSGSSRLSRALGLALAEFLFDEPSYDDFEGLVPAVNVGTQSLVDHGLVVPAACIVDLLAKPVEQVVVDSNGDPGLASGGSDDWATTSL